MKKLSNENCSPYKLAINIMLYAKRFRCFIRWKRTRLAYARSHKVSCILRYIDSQHTKTVDLTMNLQCTAATLPHRQRMKIEIKWDTAKWGIMLRMFSFTLNLKNDHIFNIEFMEYESNTHRIRVAYNMMLWEAEANHV